MKDNNIPSWKHTGCGGQVYWDRENGFFCRRCENKLSVPLDKVPRQLIYGTPFEAKAIWEKERKEQKKEEIKEALLYIVLTIAKIISR